jgi:DNA-binding MarR family transcriptional regulator
MAGSFAPQPADNPGIGFEAAPPLNGAVDLTPDPNLEPGDSNNELVILYHLQQGEGLEVDGAEAQSLMRRELGMDQGAWQKATATLVPRGILQVRKHSTSLNLKDLTRAIGQPFMTPRLIEAAEERQTGFGEAVDQTVALREASAKAEWLARMTRPPSRPRPAKKSAAEAPTAPDQPERALSPSEAERQRISHIIGLYRKMRGIAEVPLPAVAINRLLKDLPGWEYTTRGTTPQTHYLTRQAMHAAVKLKMPVASTPERNVSRDRNGITIAVEDDSVRGKDMMALLRIEGQYPYHILRREIEARRDSAQSSNEAANRFRETQGIYLRDGDVLTDRQAVVLSYMTHCGSHLELAETLEIPQGELRELVQPLRDQLGIESTNGSYDVYIGLTLVALALREASVDHLPKALKGQISNLKPDEVELLAHYYSFDPEERQAVREKRSQTAIEVMWSRIYKRIGIEGKDSRYSTVLFAVRNGILQLPDPSTIKEMLA